MVVRGWSGLERGAARPADARRRLGAGGQKRGMNWARETDRTRSGRPEGLEDVAGERGGVARDRAFSPISLAACHREYGARPVALRPRSRSGLVETVGDTVGETVGETVVGVAMASLNGVRKDRQAVGDLVCVSHQYQPGGKAARSHGV